VCIYSPPAALTRMSIQAAKALSESLLGNNK